MSKPKNLELEEEVKALKEKLSNFNVEELFYSENPSYATATIKKPATDYDFLLIIGKSSDGHDCVGGTYKPKIGDKISVMCARGYEGAVYNKQAVFNIENATTILNPENFEIRDNVAYSGLYIKLKAILGINF